MGLVGMTVDDGYGEFCSDLLMQVAAEDLYQDPYWVWCLLLAAVFQEVLFGGL